MERSEFAQFSSQFSICTHQHGCSEIKLVKELGDEDVALNQTLGVCLFDITNDVSEPFPLFLTTSHPDEKYLIKIINKKRNAVKN